MRVFITGGTGLIGRRLVQRLKERGDHPVVLSRQADRARLNPALRGTEILQGDPLVPGGWEMAVDGCDAVVNLVGENIFGQRWTSNIKRLLRDSRVNSTENVVAAMSKASHRPKVLVQASAVGYYGHRGDEELTEESTPGDDFMAVICREWEQASVAAESLGARVARVRIGVVLSLSEGALAQMIPIFKYVPGGAAPVGQSPAPRKADDSLWLRLLKGAVSPLRPASGQQWMSWIHLEDIVGLLLLGLDHSEASGPLNGTAPNPVRNSEFAQALTHALRRRVWPQYLPFGPPDFVLQMMLGEVAQVVTKGQRVLPARALALGYTFQYPDLETALAQLLKRPRPVAKPEPALAAR